MQDRGYSLPKDTEVLGWDENVTLTQLRLILEKKRHYSLAYATLWEA